MISTEAPVCGAWMMLPGDLKADLPQKVTIAIAAFLGVGGFIARMIDQNKPDDGTEIHP